MVCLLLYQSAVGPQNLHGEKHKSSYLDLAVCGLNAGLWGGSQAAAVREAWRLCLFGVLSPLGRLVESELREKLEDTVTLSWQELRASDPDRPMTERNPHSAYIFIEPRAGYWMPKGQRPRPRRTDLAC